MASSDQSNWIGTLDPNLPAGSEKLSDGDDSIRHFKKVTQDTLPNLVGEVTWNDTDLNYLDAHTTIDGSQLIFDLNTTGNAQMIIVADGVSINNRILGDVADPTLDSHVGDMGFNDIRYELATDATDAYDLLLFYIEIVRNECHPIWSTYIVYDNQNPGSARNGTSSRLGFGTWARVANGRFLVGIGTHDDGPTTRTYNVGNDSVGKYRHRLTEAEMPSHRHSIDNTAGTGHVVEDGNGHDHNAIHVTRRYTNYTGGNSYHENSPPAYGLYIWVRTA